MKIFIALILSFQLVACNWYGDPPGEGVIAENYYKKSEPLIDALEKYYADNGKYPEKLSMLAPSYLSLTSDHQEFLYISTQGSYELSFSYEGPGVNSCIYTPRKGWKCSGLI